MKTIRLLSAVYLIGLLLLQPARAVLAGAEALQAGQPKVLLLEINGVIAPASQEYLSRGLKAAVRGGFDLVILQLNTPGGSVDSMTSMAEAMRASEVPVVVYVSPRGAMAASAGTIITLAGHAAAMAPETIIGAASPVGAQGEDLPTTEQQKVTNALKALVRTYAERRGPQAVELAEDTVESARAATASEALEAGLVDFLASDLDDLLAQLDGFTVELASGPVTLATRGAVTESLAMSLIEQLLDILTNPNIVFILLSIGAQAILIEISSPGGWVAGFIGVVCLGLAAYGLGVLPVNWFGLLFLVIAFVLFIVDIKAATHGGLTAAGIGSFIVGALVLFNSPATPTFQRVSLPLVILVAIVIGLTFAVIVGFALRAQKTRIKTGQESLIGAAGTAVTDLDPAGQVQAAGELWSAEAAQGSARIRKGERVEVVKVEGLRLKVKKL